MLKYFILFIAIGFLFSCSQNNKQGQQVNTSDSTAVDTIAIINDPKNNLNVQTNTFEEIDSSGIIMFPLSMGETARSDDSYSYKKIPYNSYWNIIFYNSKTTTYHLLSERKMLIGSINLSYSSNDNVDIAYSNRHIFFKVTTDDYTLDKKLTSADPEYLFVSDKEGNNFRQISPTDCNLKSWEFIKSTNKVIMTVTKDSDKNKEFGNQDEVCSFQIDIDKETSPTEIFSAEFKKKLKVMYDKDWKRIKK